MSDKIAPLFAVRTALGLSMMDAAIILNDPDHEVLDMDTLPSNQLSLLAEMAALKEGQVYLTIRNPDDSEFARWLVTTDGYLIPVDDK